MGDERTDEHDPRRDPPKVCPAGPGPVEPPRVATFEDEWDDAPTTNTFRFPRS